MGTIERASSLNGWTDLEAIGPLQSYQRNGEPMTKMVQLGRAFAETRQFSVLSLRKDRILVGCSGFARNPRTVVEVVDSLSGMTNQVQGQLQPALLPVQAVVVATKSVICDYQHKRF